MRDSVRLGKRHLLKTTLALQIAQNAIVEESHFVIFIMVEEPGRGALEQLARSYWNRDLDSYLCGDRKEVNSYLVFDARQSLDKQFAPEMAKRRAIRLATEFYMNPPHNLCLADAERRAWGEFKGEAAFPGAFRSEAERRHMIEITLAEMNLEDVLGELWNQLASELRDRSGNAALTDESDTVGAAVAAEKPAILIVIDSLNALVHDVQTHFLNHDDRQMLLSIIRSFRACWEEFQEQGTVLITAEAPTVEFKAAESYLADVVVELHREQREYKIPAGLANSAPWSEELLFCTIRKGRGLPIERRSCCYEFVCDQHEQGIKFYPTYAAQGVVSLFHENQPQREVIETLRTVDGPALYPGVIVQEFTRSALQKALAIRRYAEKIPLRHSLLLSNVDEYWVADLRKRDLLHAIDARDLRLYSARLPQNESQEKAVRRNGVILVDEETKIDNRGLIIDEIMKKETFDEYLFHREVEGNRVFYAIPEFGNVGMIVYRHDLVIRVDAKPPKTWEQLESICRLLRKQNRPHKLLLESRTYDTMFTTLLELGWSHGVFWHTEPRDTEEPENERNLRVCFDAGSIDDFVKVAMRLHRWVHEDQIVTRGPSVDPVEHPLADWAFARHWYSTLGRCIDSHRQERKSRRSN